MKKNLSYIDSVHRDGRIWNIGVMILLIMFPVSVALIFGAAPDWGALLVGLIATAPMYWAVGVVAQDSRDGKGPARESVWSNWDQAHVLPSRPSEPPPSTPCQPVLTSPACSF